MQTVRTAIVTWLAAAAVVSGSARFVEAQNARDRRDPPPTAKQLETRIEEAEGALLKEYMSVANEYYKQDRKEDSMAVLERIAQINPKLPGLKEEMDKLREEMLQANELELEIDTSRGWGNAVAEVQDGKPFRIQAAGEYKLTLTGTIPMTGFPTTDPTQHHSAEAPFGALIGVILKDGKPGRVFPVTESMEYTPKESGQLFFRVNVPAGAKCVGTIRIRMTGAVQAPTRAR